MYLSVKVEKFIIIKNPLNQKKILLVQELF